jgi:hypothetical protein
VEEVEGMAPEYPGIVARFLGPAAEGYLARLRVKRQVRITITPKRWHILDFVERRPKSLS